MTKQAERRRTRSPFLPLILLLAGALALANAARADDAPKSDPSGLATGDRTTTTDAAGNPFTVPEPTDKSAPDYAQNKKASDDYQAQAAREPLATKLADNVGHLRLATNFAWTLNTGYLVLFMQRSEEHTSELQSP